MCSKTHQNFSYCLLFVAKKSKSCKFWVKWPKIAILLQVAFNNIIRALGMKFYLGTTYYVNVRTICLLTNWLRQWINSNLSSLVIPTHLWPPFKDPRWNYGLFSQKIEKYCCLVFGITQDTLECIKDIVIKRKEKKTKRKDRKKRKGHHTK